MAQNLFPSDMRIDFLRRQFGRKNRLYKTGRRISVQFRFPDDLSTAGISQAA
jgi:hypothetical protein